MSLKYRNKGLIVGLILGLIPFWILSLFNPIAMIFLFYNYGNIALNALSWGFYGFLIGCLIEYLKNKESTKPMLFIIGSQQRDISKIRTVVIFLAVIIANFLLGSFILALGM